MYLSKSCKIGQSVYLCTFFHYVGRVPMRNMKILIFEWKVMSSAYYNKYQAQLIDEL